MIFATPVLPERSPSLALGLRSLAAHAHVVSRLQDAVLVFETVGSLRF